MDCVIKIISLGAGMSAAMLALLSSCVETRLPKVLTTAHSSLKMTVTLASDIYMSHVTGEAVGLRPNRQYTAHQ